MWLLPLLFLAQVNPAEAPHLEKNPVYRELRESGVSITSEKSFKLPEPYLPDGLDADEQKKLIEKLGGRRYPWARLTRNTTVAPQIIQIQEQKLENTDTKARVVDVYFVAYGDVDAILQGDERNEPEDSADKEWTALAEAELAERKITIQDPKHESFGYITNNLIDEVRLSGVLRTYWSESEESVVAAAMLDPRFDEDPKYPNRWQPLERGREGFVAGKPSAYHGAAGYSKITRLKALKNAVFVESHLIFAEPHGWFDGANLLGSKLPAVIQHEVRTARQDFLKAGKE